MSVNVKICGINSAAALDAAVAGGARMLGFVFFNKSPRVVSPDEARDLLARVPAGITKVALMVEPNDIKAHAVGRQLPFDMIQLHGCETVQRVADLKTLTGLPVMKAVGIENAADLTRAHDYEALCDYLLLDAKAPPGAVLPGGNAVSFDWRILHGERWPKPWLLAGGLNTENLVDAVRISGAKFVDVSSGVEDAPGQKSGQKIADFLALAKTL